MYAAARVVGDCVRRVSDLDRDALLEGPIVTDCFPYNTHTAAAGSLLETQSKQ